MNTDFSYPDFSNNNKLPNNNNPGKTTTNILKTKGIRWLDIYQEANVLNFKYSNLKTKNYKTELQNHNIIKDKDAINKIINKFELNLKGENILKNSVEIKHQLSSIEDRVNLTNENFISNNLNVLRKHLDYISIEELNKIEETIKKNEIINQSLLEKNSIENNSSEIEIGDIKLIDNNKNIIRDIFIKYRNIFLLDLDYKNLNMKEKENFVKFLKKLIQMGYKDKTINIFDIEKLNIGNNDNSNNNSNKIQEYNNIKIINDLFDKNHFNNQNLPNNNNQNNIYPSFNNQNIPNNNNQIGNNYNISNQNSCNIQNINNPTLNKNDIFYPNFLSNQIQVFDAFNINNSNNNNSQSQPQKEKSFSNYYNNENDYPKFQNNSNNKNKNIDNSEFEFSLFCNVDNPAPLEDFSSNNNNSNNFDLSNKNFEIDKNIAKELLINEFKLSINQPTMQNALAENFFAGSDDILFALSNYFEYKYQSEKLDLTFVFPSKKEYKVKKDFTDKPSEIFEEILKIAYTLEKINVYEFEIFQDNKVIEIGKNTQYLGSLNIDKNKKIIVKYTTN